MDERCIPTVRVFAVVMLFAVCSASIGGPAHGSLLSVPVVVCGDIIGKASGPRVEGYRLVLGVMSVPPAYMAQGAVHVDGFGRWRYWHKAGMVVRAGKFTVTVAVPKAWRSRAAITWGNRLGIVNSLRFSGCGTAPLVSEWNAYAGGFYLRAPSACVPLVFRVGHRSTTVRFGIGRHCS